MLLRTGPERALAGQPLTARLNGPDHWLQPVTR